VEWPTQGGMDDEGLNAYDIDSDDPKPDPDVLGASEPPLPYA
jgi:hypothetical protein